MNRSYFNDFMRTILWLPPQASSVAREMDQLHYFVIITTMIASVGVALTALSFFVLYRRRSDTDLTPQILPAWWFEVIVVVGPLAFFLTWFAIGYRQFVHIESPPPNTLDVYVTAKQWMWKFAYPNGPSAAGVLRVPAYRPVRLLLTSRDVIHSFYVGEFRIKKDAVPGRYTQTWFEGTEPGTYDVLCAEYCGTSHSMMRAQVIVMPPEDFEAWLSQASQGLREEQDTPPAEADQHSGSNMAQLGRALAVKYECLRCHTVDGTAHIGPTWLGLYGRNEKLDGGESITVDEAYITESMMDPMAKIVLDYKPVMPTYRGRIEAADVGAIIEFIKSLPSGVIQTGPSEGQTYEPIPAR